MRLLFYGDIVAKSGRDAVCRTITEFRRELQPDVIIANGENSAGGLGITGPTMKEIFDAGVDVITLGNHVWAKDDTYDLLGRFPRLLRPANLPENAPGSGMVIVNTPAGEKAAVINLIGRYQCGELNQSDPFAMADRLVAEAKQQTRAILVDFHAEATSEKGAMAWHLDGRVSAVVGTHTHVQTNDACILPRGTGFITDAGMNGPADSILGVDPEISVYRFTTGMPCRYKTANCEATLLNAVVVDIDTSRGVCTKIEAINRRM